MKCIGDTGCLIHLHLVFLINSISLAFLNFHKNIRKGCRRILTESKQEVFPNNPTLTVHAVASLTKALTFRRGKARARARARWRISQARAARSLARSRLLFPNAAFRISSLRACTLSLDRSSFPTRYRLRRARARARTARRRK